MPAAPPSEQELGYRWDLSAARDSERWSPHSSLTDSAAIVPPPHELVKTPQGVEVNWRDAWEDYPAFCLRASKDDEAFKEFRKVYVERGYAGIDNDSYAQREAVAGVFRAFRDGDYRVVNELTSHLGRLTPVAESGRRAERSCVR